MTQLTVQSLLGLSTIAVSVIVGLICFTIALVVGFFSSVLINKAKMSKNKATAQNILQDALNEAKQLKKEAILQSKEEAQRIKDECETEVRERRNEVVRLESRIVQREDFIQKKEEILDKKSDTLDNVRNELKTKEEQLTSLIEGQTRKNEEVILELEKVSKMTKDEAKAELVYRYEDEAKKDAAIIVRNIEQEAKDEANKKAKEIITLAIQKCASDHTSEVTVSSVTLPNDEMKGRIIGREGRNIRTLENATGVDLIIDDTPEAVVISSFDPIRREIARLSLEKLILDGRIQPARIEEMVEKVKKEIDQTIKEAGEEAVFEAGIHGIHPELVKILGRLKYRTSYGQNVLKHSLEVSRLAGLMAAELGANVNIAKRGGLLHDIGKAMDFEMEGTHVSIGIDLATKFKEVKGVIHCIAAHHNDVEFETLEAMLVQAADAISSSRPGARRESLETYVKRLQKLEEIANTFKGVEKSYAIQAGREIRIIVKPTEVSDDYAIILAKEVAQKVEKEMEYPGQIKVNIIRETRAVDYAK